MGLPIKDIAERALSSAGEQFLTVVALGGTVLSLTGLPWKFALATSLGAALISVLLSVIQFSVSGTPPFWIDTFIRIVKSFAASLLATLGGGAAVLDITSVPWKTALNIAAGVAVITLVKCVLAAATHTTGASLVRNAGEIQPAEHRV